MSCFCTLSPSAVLFAELAKPHHRVFWGRKWVRLEALEINTVEPIHVHFLAHIRAAVFSVGVLAVHVDRCQCVLFRAGRHPDLVDLSLGLELLKSRLALGLAIAGGSMYIIQIGKYKARYKAELQAVL